MFIKIIITLITMMSYSWDFDLMLKDHSILKVHVLSDSENLNKLDDKGRTLLNMMIKNNKSLKEIEFLLKNGGDANLKDKKGNLPLTHAINNKNKELIILLLEYGAFLELKDTSNNKLKDKLKKSKIDIEIKNIKNKYIPKFIRSKASLFFKHVRMGKLEILKLYKDEFKYYVNYKDHFYLYLQNVSRYKGNESFEYLLSLYDKQLDTLKLSRVFISIAFSRNIESLKVLLKYKIDLNILNSGNRTILDQVYSLYDRYKPKFYSKKNIKSSLEIINLLKEYGAKRSCEILKTKCDDIY